MSEVTRKIVGVVPVRKGSKGLQNKNIRKFAGRPLFQHAVEQGIRCCKSCIISTDISEILNGFQMDGCTLIGRDASISSDNAPMSAVIMDIIQKRDLDDEVIVLLQATSPLREDKHVFEAIELYMTGRFDIVMSVREEDSSILKSGFLSDGFFSGVVNQEFCFANRQDLPSVVKPSGAVYVFSSSWFLENGGFNTNRIGAVKISKEQSLDIDNLNDFVKAEKTFMSRNTRVR